MVPGPCRYWTDDEVRAEQEPPRLVTATTYLADGLGYILDRPSKMFLLGVSDVAGGIPESVQLTTSHGNDTGVHWIEDGVRLGFLSAREPGGDARFADDLRNDVASIKPDGSDLRLETATDLSITDFSLPGERLLLLADGPGPSGRELVAHNAVLFEGPGKARRAWTDAETMHMVGRIVPCGSGVLLAREERGRTLLELCDCSDVTTVLGGEVSVMSYDTAGETIVAVAATPTSFGEVFIGNAQSGLRRRTDFGRDLARAAPPIPAEVITATSKDGYPVHGWLLPPKVPDRIRWC